MRVDAAVLAHAGLTARTQRPDGAAARGSAPANEATAQTTVTAAEETLAGQTSQTDPEARSTRLAELLEKPGVKLGIRRQLGEPGTAAAPPGKELIAAIQSELGIGRRVQDVEPSSEDEEAEPASLLDLVEGDVVDVTDPEPEPDTTVDPLAQPVLPDLESTIDPNNLEDVEGLPEIRLGGGSVPGGTAALLNLLSNYESPFPEADDPGAGAGA